MAQRDRHTQSVYVRASEIASSRELVQLRRCSPLTALLCAESCLVGLVPSKQCDKAARDDDAAACRRRPGVALARTDAHAAEPEAGAARTDRRARRHAKP